jgi:hypothetical protein
MRALAAAALTALLLLALTPTGRADDNIYSGADNPVYAMKGGNGYFYVFYRDTNNNIRYQYYDGSTWSTSTTLVSGNVNGDDDFVVGFYGLTYVLILYQQFVSGNTYNVYILKCTVAAPLSCGSPASINPPGENAIDAQELTLTYNPSPGRWYAGYVYYSTVVGGYEYITFTSTDGSTWSRTDWNYPGSSVPSQAFRFHVTAIPGTSNAFAFTAARYDESYYRVLHSHRGKPELQHHALHHRKQDSEHRGAAHTWHSVHVLRPGGDIHKQPVVPMHKQQLHRRHHRECHMERPRLAYAGQQQHLHVLHVRQPCEAADGHVLGRLRDNLPSCAIRTEQVRGWRTCGSRNA